MSKRLEEIEERFYKTGYEINTASPEPQQIHADLQYLIYTVKERAEQLKELEEENKVLKAIETGHELQIEISRNKNKRYRETLEFYSDRENYNPNILCPTGNVYMSVMDYDEGEEARKALSQTSKNKKLNDLTEEERQDFSEKLRTWFD